MSSPSRRVFSFLFPTHLTFMQTIRKNLKITHKQNEVMHRNWQPIKFKFYFEKNIHRLLIKKKCFDSFGKKEGELK